MKNIKFLLLAITILLGSCNNFLEEEAYSFKNPAELLQTEASAEAYMIGVYDRLSNRPFGKSFGQGLLVVANFGTDDFSGKGAANQIYGDYMNYTFTPAEERLDLIWNNFYSGINQASAIINNIPASPSSEATKNKLGSEAKFMRAFYYFYLVRMFGGVPLITEETTSLDALNTPRASIEEVYTLILKDLTEAAPLLPAVNQTPAGRATKGAALALLTKVYLSMAAYGKYKPLAGYEWVNVNEAFTKAVTTGQQVIDMPDYALLSNYGSIFEVATENNSEIIFSVQMHGSSQVSDEGSWLANFFAPASVGDINVSRGGMNHARPTRNLINKYATGDTRKTWNIVNFSYNGCTEVPGPTTLAQTFTGKFRKPCGYDGQHFSDPINVPLLRLADVMLMVAEASAELNDGAATPIALQLVTSLRTKRYLATVVPAAPTGNFLDFIFDERSRELCYEGQRWFDLARTGRLINAVKATQLATATTTAPANIQTKHYLYPIPLNEILNNAAIDFTDQNPGY